MQLDKTQGYIFRIKDVEQAKAVVEVLVSQGYCDDWEEEDYKEAVSEDLVTKPNNLEANYGTCLNTRVDFNWVDTEMFLEYTSVPKVKETIQVGDTVFDKEEFQQATAHLKGVKV